MAYQVVLLYFRQTGKFLATAQATIEKEQLLEIWNEVDEMRRMGRLPGLRPGAGRDLLIVVDVTDHPRRVLHLVMPPFVDEDDVTPPHVSVEEGPRTSTRDIVKIDLDADVEADTVVVVPNDEITPIERPIRIPDDNKPR